MSEKVYLDPTSIRPNSHKSKAESQERERTTHAPIVPKEAVVRSKKKVSKKIAQRMDLADTREVRDYVLEEKLIPGAKDLALDILEMIFFNRKSDRGNRGRSYDDRPSYRHDYRSDYGGRDRNRNYDRDRRESRRYDNDEIDYQNIVLGDRRHAQRIVDRLQDEIADLGSVSIATLYELVGIASNHTDNKWGWTRSSDIGIRRVADGFLIDVAPARYLD